MDDEPTSTLPASVFRNRGLQVSGTRPYPIPTISISIPSNDSVTRHPLTPSDPNIPRNNSFIHDRDISGMSGLELEQFIAAINFELSHRNASGASSTPLSSSKYIDRPLPTHAHRGNFADLTPEEFSRLASAALKEHKQRFPPQSGFSQAIACPRPIRPTSGLSMDAAHSDPWRSSPLNENRRSYTTDVRHPRSPLASRRSRPAMFQSVRRQSRAPPASQTPLSPVSDTTRGSDSNGFESEEFGEGQEPSRDSSIRRLHKMLAERDREIAQIKADREEEVGRWKLEKDVYADRIRRLQDEARQLGDKVRDLETKQCPLVSMSTSGPHGTDLPVRTLIRDSATVPALSAFVHELALASSSLSEREIVDSILDRMQEILDGYVQSGRRSCQDQAGSIRRLLLRSCRDLDILPPSFFIVGVQCRNPSSPTSGGGFSDIFGATLKGQPVALKRLRSFLYNKNRRDVFLGFQKPSPSVRPESSKPTDGSTSASEMYQTASWRQLDMPPEFYQEAIIWRQLAHPYIQPFLGIDRATFPQSVCMVSPWLTLGSIRNEIERFEAEGLDPPVDRWISEIAEGLAYLHNEKVVHGDLRGNNVLMDGPHPRLTDFGLARFTDAHTRTMGSHSGGNERWMSPELLDNSLLKPDEKCDVYSFACTCIELYSRESPFSGVRQSAVTAKVLSGERPQRPGISGGQAISDEMWDLVQRCWHQNPSERPTMAEVVEWLESGRPA